MVKSANRWPGFLIIVFPGIQQVFLAWFTYDAVRPAEEIGALLGDPGHRWLTAQGPYFGNKAILDIYVISGGVFDSSTPQPVTEPDGKIILDFSSCSRGTVTYDITSNNWQNVIPIERVVLDNVTLC